MSRSPNKFPCPFEPFRVLFSFPFCGVRDVIHTRRSRFCSRRQISSFKKKRGAFKRGIMEWKQYTFRWWNSQQDLFPRQLINIGRLRHLALLRNGTKGFLPRAAFLTLHIKVMWARWRTPVRNDLENCLPLQTSTNDP